MQVVVHAVTQDVTVVEDFQVTYVDQADFVCVHQVDQKRLPNVFGVKTVHTADVNNLIAVVLTVLHWQCVVQQVADMAQLTVHQICTSLCQVHHLQELQECHVQVVINHMDRHKETTEYSQEGVVLQE